MLSAVTCKPSKLFCLFETLCTTSNCCGPKSVVRSPHFADDCRPTIDFPCVASVYSVSVGRYVAPLHIGLQLSLVVCIRPAAASQYKHTHSQRLSHTLVDQRVYRSSPYIDICMCQLTRTTPLLTHMSVQRRV